MIILWKSLARLRVRMDVIGVDENDNKHEDASHDYVDDFNDATCEVCL
jgi:hypothetical protein